MEINIFYIPFVAGVFTGHRNNTYPALTRLAPDCLYLAKFLVIP